MVQVSSRLVQITVEGCVTICLLKPGTLYNCSDPIHGLCVPGGIDDLGKAHILSNEKYDRIGKQEACCNRKEKNSILVVRQGLLFGYEMILVKDIQPPV